MPSLTQQGIPVSVEGSREGSGGLPGVSLAVMAICVHAPAGACGHSYRCMEFRVDTHTSVSSCIAGANMHSRHVCCFHSVSFLTHPEVTMSSVFMCSTRDTDLLFTVSNQRSSARAQRCDGGCHKS